MPRRTIAVAALAALALTLLVPPLARGRAVDLTVGFDRNARLGAPTAIHARLRIDPRQFPIPATAVELTYPNGLGITTSGLGLEPCILLPSHFTDVVIFDTGLAGCPTNSVIARGRARGQIRLGADESTVIRELGEVTVISGPVHHGTLQLIALVAGQRPFAAKLAYAGEARSAPPPFGGSLNLTLPPIPETYNATVLLTHLTLGIGSNDIVYTDDTSSQRVRYRPGGIELPTTCPRRGFPFRLTVTFRDGRTNTATARAPCPRAR